MNRKIVSLPAHLPAPAGGTPLSAAHAAELTPILIEILQSARRELALLGDMQEESTPQLGVLVEKAAQTAGCRLSRLEVDLIVSEIEKEKRDFGVLDELVRDDTISDIIVHSYTNVQVQQGRVNYQTAVRFPSQAAYEALVERLLLKAGSGYSNKQPLADGMVGPYVRVHAVHKCLAENGPYLTIRINRFSSIDTQTLHENGLAPEPVFRYLETLVEGGVTGLIIGEVGTGKTTLTRALAGSIPLTESILVIEDTREIRLNHPRVRSVITRTANVEGQGRISPSEVIRAGMRMAMNRIIFGEIRDPEAAEAFVDVCASGHPGLTTLHARNPSDALVRLGLFLARAQKNVGKDVIHEQLATAIGFIVSVDVCPVTRKRRISEVREIGPVCDGALRQKTVFKYTLQDSMPAWKVVNPISNYRDALEAGGVRLSDLHGWTYLPEDHLYREAQTAL